MMEDITKKVNQKKIFIFLGIVLAIIILAFWGISHNMEENVAPYRGITYGMSHEEIKDIEIQNGSRKDWVEGGKKAYDATIAGHKARIVYVFEDNSLTSFSIIVMYSDIIGCIGDGHPEEFFADLMKELDELYGEHTKEDSIYLWFNDYEVISGTIAEIVGASTVAKFEFNLLNKSET